MVFFLEFLGKFNLIVSFGLVLRDGLLIDIFFRLMLVNNIYICKLYVFVNIYKWYLIYIEIR